MSSTLPVWGRSGKVDRLVSSIDDVAAMVLCAGLGTRLRPLTLELPKPLLPVGDRALLAHIVEELVAAGFGRMTINTHHLAEEFPRVLGQLPIEATAIHESEIRGTAGGVAGAGLGAERVLVWNGDIFVRPPIAELCDRARTTPMVMCVSPRAVGEGTVGLDGDRVVRLRGERFGTERSGGDFVGVCALGAEALDALPEFGCLIADLALPKLREGRDFVRTVETHGAWSDIGTPAAYLELNLAWLDEGHRTSFVATDARVEAGIDISGSIVGAGARVEGSGVLARSVVWPGATARAPGRDLIVTPKIAIELTR